MQLPHALANTKKKLTTADSHTYTPSHQLSQSRKYHNFCISQCS